MKQEELDIQIAIWLKKAYDTALKYKHSEILPLHLYNSILTDRKFCSDLWKENPGLRKEFSDFLNIRLSKINPLLDIDTHPAMSEELAGIIAFAKAIKFPSLAPLSPALLFNVLLTKETLFPGKPQALLQKMATGKIESLLNPEARTLVRDAFDTKFFLTFNAASFASQSAPKKPPVTFEDTLRKKIPGLGQELRKVIYGQDEAIQKVHSTLAITAAGFERSNKTAGSFLFRGPTGTGKTELAREIAFELGIPLLKFDMSEYKESHSVSRFIGSPPGYVGSTSGGRLINKVNASPCCVVLLDEIEKAHPDIYDLLLQVMDDATLTDGRGISADFTNVILIMSSNVGAREATKEKIGFSSGGKDQDKNESANEALKILFSPEFRNRLDGDLIFNDVKKTVMPLIVTKFIEEFHDELNHKNLVGEFSQAAQNYLVKLGRDSEFGARDVLRIIEQQIKVAVAFKIIEGDLPQGAHVFVDYDEQKKLFVDIDVIEDQDDVSTFPLLPEVAILSSTPQP